MKIVIDARMLGWSGIGRYTSKLLEHLQQQDQQNHYMVLLDPPSFETWQPTAANFSKVLAPQRPFSLAEQLSLPRLLAKLKPDLVHFTSFNVPLLFRGRAVITIHDLNMLHFPALAGNRLKRLVSVLKRWPAKLVMRLGAKHATAVITPSKYVAQQLQTELKLPSVKLKVVHEAAEPLTLEPKAVRHLQDAEFLLYVGNAYPNKNLWRLVQAFTLVQADRPNLRLVLAGRSDSFYQLLQAKVIESGYTSVLLPGSPSDAQLVWLYQHALAFVTPSLAEGFGLPGLEAMTYGLPVLAARASCLPEIYGQAAVYFEPTNVEAIAETISNTLANTKRLELLRQLGPKQASHYSWSKMAAQTLEIYTNQQVSTKPA